ncbi:hypothetical protein ACB092_03G148500 [Castanea dentata]
MMMHLVLPLGALQMQVSPKEVIYDSRGLSKEPLQSTHYQGRIVLNFLNVRLHSMYPHKHTLYNNRH